MFEDIYTEAFQFLTKTVTSRPKIGIVCGSGLGKFGDTVKDVKIFDYKDIPNFPISTVEGHKGCLVFGNVNGIDVICMQGRFHLYEGYKADACAFPIRVMKLFGVEKLILTNAAGGLNPKYNIGDFMILKDHLNLPALCGLSPVIGTNNPLWGPRFPSMQNCYDSELRKLGLQVAKDIGETKLHSGIYSCIVGPCYETIAEMKLLQVAGTDALGMSTVYEVVAARHCGIKCVAVSLITNKCQADYDDQEDFDHSSVLEASKSRGNDMVKFITALIAKM